MCFSATARSECVSYTVGVSHHLPRALALTAAPILIGAGIALVLGLIVGGAALPQLLVDPGPTVRWGIPVAKGLVNLGAAASLGSLLLAALAFARDSLAFGRALVTSAIGAGVWALASLATAVLTFLSIYLEPISFSDRFGEVLWLFLTETELGLALLFTSVAAAVVSVLSVLVRSYPGVAVTGFVAVAAVWPLAEQGHAAGSANHQIAVSSWFVHAVFAAFWVGGLVTMLVAHWSDSARQEGFRRAIERYSTIALVSFIVVGVSGVTNALIRVGSLEGLASPYGLLVLAKAGALGLLGAWGVWYRRRLIGDLGGSEPTRARRVLGSVMAMELAIMGAAMGLAVALSRTQTPVVAIPASGIPQATPAEILTGEPLPPEFTWGRLFTEWRPDVIWLLIVGFGIFFYLAGHYRLASRGDSWPALRTIAWVSGMAILGLSTSSGLAVYGTYLFSIHMLSHMLLSMAAPLLLVLSAPVTLASRAIQARRDGSRGPREWILAIVHSRYLAVIGHPLVAASIFGLSLIVFYYSPLFEWALREHLGHQWMILHFVFSGYLFAQALVGVDPSPHNPPYPLRLIIVLATMAFHAFFGLSLIYGTGLLAADWYGAMGREWGLNPLADQQRGGELAWGLGEIPTLVLAVVVTYGWMRSDDRANKRRDRRVEREGDRELDDYNEMLRARADHEARRASRG